MMTEISIGSRVRLVSHGKLPGVLSRIPVGTTGTVVAVGDMWDSEELCYRLGPGVVWDIGEGDLCYTRRELVTFEGRASQEELRRSIPSCDSEELAQLVGELLKHWPQ